MEYLLPVLVLAALYGLIVLGMRWGWRRRAARQADLPPLAADLALADLGEEHEHGPVEAVYVSTVLAEQPLERVVAHGLGVRSRATITLGTGGSWRLDREGAPSFTIPADAVDAVDAAAGQVGKFIGGDGLLVIRWRLGDQQLDTALRLARRSDHDLLLSRKEHS